MAGDRKGTTRLGIWHFLSLLVVVGAGGALVWAAFEEFANNRDTETGLAIVGAVLPSLVAMGAAMFGISAFRTGVASGAAAGEAQAEASEERRRKEAAETSAALADLLGTMRDVTSGPHPEALTAEQHTELIRLEGRLAALRDVTERRSSG